MAKPGSGQALGMAIRLARQIGGTEGTGGLMYFQIHRNGMAVDGVSYTSLEEAAAALEKAAEGGEVTQVDAGDEILRRYTPDECRSAARKFRLETKHS